MDLRPVLAVLRAGFALLTLAAMGYQFAALAVEGTLNPVNFLSYFTIQSNLIGAAVFLVGAARWRRPRTHGWELVRGAAVLYLTVTFVVFAVLLADTNVDTATSWVNTTVHGIFPLAVMADWLIDPPRTRLGGREVLAWLAYPLAWVGYTMLRGALVGWYPYPFLDPANGGYLSAARYIVGIVGFGLVVIAIIRLVGNLLGGRRARGDEDAVSPPAPTRTTAG